MLFVDLGQSSILAGTLSANASSAMREHAMNRGSLYGFRAGCLIYSFALLVELGSQT